MTESSKAVITRSFAAPVDLVFACWTQAAHAIHWYGPAESTVPICEIDGQRGGKLRICVMESDGTECWEEGEFEKFEENVELGWQSNVRYSNFPAAPMQTAASFSFDEGQTLVIVTQTCNEEHFTENAQSGWNQAFDRLTAYLATIDHGVTTL